MTPAQAVLYYLGRTPMPGPEHVTDLLESAREAKRRHDTDKGAISAVLLALCHHMSVREIEDATGWPKTTVHTYARAAAVAQKAASDAAIDRAEEPS